MEEKIPVQVKVCMLTWLENLEKSGVSKNYIKIIFRYNYQIKCQDYRVKYKYEKSRISLRSSHTILIK